MSNQELPFALLAWIKRQQEEKRQHAEYMVKRSAKDDEHYLKLMIELITKLSMTTRERITVTSLLQAKHDGKNLSTGQKSLIAGMYYNKVG
jgi:cell division FtsZ-interacting protein ZapD